MASVTKRIKEIQQPTKEHTLQLLMYYIMG